MLVAAMAGARVCGNIKHDPVQPAARIQQIISDVNNRGVWPLHGRDIRDRHWAGEDGDRAQ